MRGRTQLALIGLLIVCGVVDAAPAITSDGNQTGMNYINAVRYASGFLPFYNLDNLPTFSCAANSFMTAFTNTTSTCTSIVQSSLNVNSSDYWDGYTNPAAIVYNGGIFGTALQPYFNGTMINNSGDLRYPALAGAGGNLNMSTWNITFKAGAGGVNASAVLNSPWLTGVSGSAPITCSGSPTATCSLTQNGNINAGLGLTGGGTGNLPGSSSVTLNINPSNVVNSTWCTTGQVVDYEPAATCTTKWSALPISDASNITTGILPNQRINTTYLYNATYMIQTFGNLTYLATLYLNVSGETRNMNTTSNVSAGKAFVSVNGNNVNCWCTNSTGALLITSPCNYALCNT